MAPIDGVELFRQATTRFPSIRQRFVFVSGHVEVEADSFIQDSGVPLVRKPFRVATLRRAVQERLEVIPTRPANRASG